MLQYLAKEDERLVMRMYNISHAHSRDQVLLAHLQVPHAAQLAYGDEAYRQALGTRPPLPPLPAEYDRLKQIFRCCTHHFAHRESHLCLNTDSLPGNVSHVAQALSINLNVAQALPNS